MRRKQILLGMMLTVAVITAVLCSTLIAGANGQVYTTSAYTGFNAQQRVGASWTALRTPFHYDQNNNVSYCLEHTKDFPTGQGYVAYGGPSDATKRGLNAILQNGYPFVTPSGLTATQARYATANAVRSWLAERGEANNYAFMALSANRVRSSGASWDATFAWYQSLVRLAQNGSVLNPRVTLTQVGEWELVGDNFVTRIRVSWADARSYSLSTPSGISRSGVVATNTNNTVTLTVPTSDEGRTFVASVQLQDNRSASSYHYWTPSSNSALQRVVTVVPTSVNVASGSITLQVPEMPRPDYHLRKVDADNPDVGLAGAIFDIYECLDELVCTCDHLLEVEQSVETTTVVEVETESAEESDCCGVCADCAWSLETTQVSWRHSLESTRCVLVDSVVTDAQGYASFKGEDHEKRYCLVEQMAPVGYEPYLGRMVFFLEKGEEMEPIHVPNKKVSTAVDVLKKTIDVTSAGFVSLPDEAGIDNTGLGNKELYRYDVDYRSRASSWADELVLDDPLEAVARDQIRVEELWTPIVYGDSDGRFNLWYKTNLTDDAQLYSAVKAADNDPLNPHNPKRFQRLPNTGWKLWAQDVEARERRHLRVDDLSLEEGEYIAAIRLEHGRVEKGFTSRNTADWVPKLEQVWYTAKAAQASGLQPLTYMVYCPNPLIPEDEDGETVIINSASAHITRDIILYDDAVDTVETRVIESFTFEPMLLGVPELSEEETSTALYGTVTKPRGLPNTGDSLRALFWFALVTGAALLCWRIITSSRKEYQEVKVSAPHLIE